MYRLIFSLRYISDLERVDDPTDVVKQRLEGAVYWRLRNSPSSGLPFMTVPGARLIRVWIVKPLVGISVLYRVDEEDKAVTLLSLRQFTQAHLSDLDDPFADE
jgi:hypothetical protein